MTTRLRPARIEDVIDGSKLRAQLSAAALDHLGDEAGARKAALRLLHGALFRGRMIAKERFESGENGHQTARLLSAVMDEVLAALFDYVTTHVIRARNPTEGERLSVLAVGGYGRGELAPSSDIDLLFLRPYKQSPHAESVTEYILYVLWDMGLKVGHSSRTIDECIKLAKEDHTIKTALLEGRRVCGDEVLATHLAQRFRSEALAGLDAAFVAAKLKERDQRHLRSGASRYMVEPNVKEGKGGLRDLHTLFWLVRHRFGLANPHEDPNHTVFTSEESRTCKRALAFLWTVRCHIHFLTGRGEERLSFDLQPEIANRMGFATRGEQAGVERFMKRYFLIAKEVGALTRTLCAKLEAADAKKAPTGLARLSPAFKAKPKPLDVPGFRLDAGRLDADPEALDTDTTNLVRAFVLADRLNCDIQPGLLGEISKRLKRITPAVRRDPTVIALMLEAATSRHAPAATLRLMNETGVLGRMLPEFGKIVAQMQFNMYHHYTVDEHTLRAVDIMSEIEHGRLAQDHPLATAIFSKIINRRALYLAMLLHDTGKGGGDQQIEGEKSARAACERLGLPAEEVDLVGWLVRRHLLMSDTAQKRDLSDPRTVAGFVREVASLERLRLLVVLTVCDIRAVGPGVWNGWKGQLLRDLYRLSEAAFLGGRTDEASVAERLVQQAAEARQALEARFGPKRTAAAASWLDQMEPGYWLAYDLDDLAWHADVAQGHTGGPLVAARVRADRGVTECLVLAPDRPGLFAALTRALAGSGADVADARIHTLADGHTAFDLFSLHDAQGAPFGSEDPRQLKTLEQRLIRAAAAPEAVLAGPVSRPPAPRRTAAFSIEPVVRFDNALTPDATVLEVSGRDRPGLLADLSAVLAAAKVSIASAHIDAYGERVADVFYVQEAEGGQVRHGRRLTALQAKLIDVLAEGDPAAPANPARQPLAVARASTAR